MSDAWITIPNWERFQHYSDREPPWIKLYTRLGSDEDWLTLTHVERSVLVQIWIEYARSGCVLSAQRVASMVHRNVRQQCIDSLQTKGWIRVVASKPTRVRTRVRADAGSQETETELEPLTPQSGDLGTPRERGVNPRALGTNPRATAKRDRPRRQAERWIANGLADHVPAGQLRGVLEDEFGIHDAGILDALMAKATERKVTP